METLHFIISIYFGRCLGQDLTPRRTWTTTILPKVQLFGFGSVEIWFVQRWGTAFARSLLPMFLSFFKVSKWCFWQSWHVPWVKWALLCSWKMQTFIDPNVAFAAQGRPTQYVGPASHAVCPHWNRSTSSQHIFTQCFHFQHLRSSSSCRVCGQRSHGCRSHRGGRRRCGRGGGHDPSTRGDTDEAGDDDAVGHSSTSSTSSTSDHGCSTSGHPCTSGCRGCRSCPKHNKDKRSTGRELRKSQTKMSLFFSKNKQTSYIEY